MAKVKSPLLSMGASGKIANTLVFMRWKGIDDVREYVIPSNPRTAKQQAQRSKMATAVADFHASNFNDVDLTAWNLYASTMPRPMSGFNAFCREHIKNAIAEKTWVKLYNATITTPSSGQITVVIKSSEDATAKLFYGTSKTSMPSVANGTWDNTNKQWTFSLTGLSSGVVYYFYIQNTASGKGGRTGIYAKLTT